jgi:hypothetical protein
MKGLEMDDLMKQVLLRLLSNDKRDPQVCDDWIGTYVIVRCRDAGVHAGVLVSRNGRQCELSESRRLWKWVIAGTNDFLSGVSSDGIAKGSRLGCPISIVLTENCELIKCTKKAEKSIREYENE